MPSRRLSIVEKVRLWTLSTRRESLISTVTSASRASETVPISGTGRRSTTALLAGASSVIVVFGSW